MLIEESLAIAGKPVLPLLNDLALIGGDSAFSRFADVGVVPVHGGEVLAGDVAESGVDFEIGIGNVDVGVFGFSGGGAGGLMIGKELPKVAIVDGLSKTVAVERYPQKSVNKDGEGTGVADISQDEGQKIELERIVGRALKFGTKIGDGGVSHGDQFADSGVTFAHAGAAGGVAKLVEEFAEVGLLGGCGED